MIRHIRGEQNTTQRHRGGVGRPMSAATMYAGAVARRDATKKARCVFFFQKKTHLRNNKKRRAEHCGLSSRAVGDQGPFCHVCQTPVSTHTPRATASTESGDSSSSITTISSKDRLPRGFPRDCDLCLFPCETAVRQRTSKKTRLYLGAPRLRLRSIATRPRVWGLGEGHAGRLE